MRRKVLEFRQALSEETRDAFVDVNELAVKVLVSLPPLLSRCMADRRRAVVRVIRKTVRILREYFFDTEP